MFTFEVSQKLKGKLGNSEEIERERNRWNPQPLSAKHNPSTSTVGATEPQGGCTVLAPCILIPKPIFLKIKHGFPVVGIKPSQRAANPV